MPKVILDWDSKYSKGVITSDMLDIIRAHFSIANPSKRILARMGMWHAPDRISIITEGGRFDLGLYDSIVDYLTIESEVEFEIVVTDSLNQQLQRGYTFSTFTPIDLNIPLRPYQQISVDKGLEKGCGVFVIGTAGGKTLLMSSLIEHIRRNSTKTFTTIVLVPATLVEQTYKEMISYGIASTSLSRWNGDYEFQDAPIIIASISTLHASLGNYKETTPKVQSLWKPKKDITTYEKYLEEFKKKEKEKISNWKKNKKDLLDKLKSVDLLLIDEVHSLRKSNELNRIIDLFETKHMYGFTGTMPESLIDVWNIIGKIGPILIDINSAVLREGGYIAQVTAKIIEINYKNPPTPHIDLTDPTKAYIEECAFLYHSEYRNKVICKIAKDLDSNTLIMVDKIEHGEILEKMLKLNTSKQVYFIRGSVDNQDREKVKEIMERDNNVICVAMSKIFAVGINIKNLHYVVFAQGGKAKITMIQSIGRGLRKHENKNMLVILDLADILHYGKKHLAARLVHYENERISYETKSIYEQ